MQVTERQEEGMGTTARRPPDSYADFVAWRNAHDCTHVTVGDAARRFSGTPLAVLMDWWARDEGTR